MAIPVLSTLASGLRHLDGFRRLATPQPGFLTGTSSVHLPVIVTNWEYAKVDYEQEGDFSNPGQLMWSAKIMWPGADRLELRDRVRVEDVLAEMGADGWEVISAIRGNGINHTEYLLKRPTQS